MDTAACQCRLPLQAFNNTNCTIDLKCVRIKAEHAAKTVMQRMPRSASQCQPPYSETHCCSATCSAQLSLQALATRKYWQINHLCGVCHSNCECVSPYVPNGIRGSNCAHSLHFLHVKKYSFELLSVLLGKADNSQGKVRASPLYSHSTTNKMQHFTIYFCKTLYMFQTIFSVHHHELKTAHTALGICQTVTATCC